MKKISLLLVLILILSVFAVCSKEEKDTSSLEPQFTDDTIQQPGDEQQGEYLKNPPVTEEDQRGIEIELD